MVDEKGKIDYKVPERTVFLLNDEIVPETVGDAIEWILMHNFNKTRTPITLIINNYGGELCQAFALVDIIKGSKVPVHTVGLGMVASAATFVFLAGKKGHRTLTENTIFMTHQLNSGNEGKYHELVADMVHTGIRHDQMIDLYSKLSGLEKKTVKKLLVDEKDHWLTAKQAYKLGLCDQIKNFTFEEKKEKKMTRTKTSQSTVQDTKQLKRNITDSKKITSNLKKSIKELERNFKREKSSIEKEVKANDRFTTSLEKKLSVAKASTVKAKRSNKKK